ncbi:hypothetical protein GF327_02500 [Candidatus Woesearchaeota archaeon]|nr:hypothetical protein [Candidatus Woesearchaeota archaeon]
MKKYKKADVVFDEVSGLLKDSGVNEEKAEKITNEFIDYLRSQNRLDSADIEEYFEKKLENYDVDEEKRFFPMELISMMSFSCVNSCNRCFSDLDGDGTAIMLSNKKTDAKTDDQADDFFDIKNNTLQKSEEIQSLINQANIAKIQNNDNKKAIKISDKILEIDPENRNALLTKAGSLQVINKKKEALKVIKEIIQKWPEHWEAYYLLGIHFFNKNETMALKYLEKSIDFHENFDNLAITAQLVYFMGNQDYLKYLDKAKEIDPERYKNFMRTCWTYDMDMKSSLLL